MSTSAREIEIEIINKTPLHIGGTAPSLLDQPTYREGERVAIPASSLKGAARHAFEEALREVVVSRSGLDEATLARRAYEILRKAVEEVAKIVGRGDLVDYLERMIGEETSINTPLLPIVCDPLSHLHCNPPTSAMEFTEDVAETVRLIASIVLLRRVSKSKMYCPACTLFGGNGNPSPLIFHTAQAETTRTALATRVSIDRYTGAARQQRLFTVEYVPPGTKFTAKVEVADKPSIYAQSYAGTALEVAAAALKEVKQIGKHKSIGYGHVEIRITTNFSHNDLRHYAKKFIDEWCQDAEKLVKGDKDDALETLTNLLKSQIPDEQKLKEIKDAIRSCVAEICTMICR